MMVQKACASQKCLHNQDGLGTCESQNYSIAMALKPCTSHNYLNDFDDIEDTEDG
jgi:hypothetical protein